jgi:hypothetical protein
MSVARSWWLAAHVRLSEGCLGRPGRASTHRGRAVKKGSEVFVGIDTAKARNAVALAEGCREGEVRYLGEIDSHRQSMRLPGLAFSVSE